MKLHLGLKRAGRRLETSPFFRLASPVGCTYSVHAREQGIRSRSEAGLGLSVEAGRGHPGRTKREAGPPEVELRALRRTASLQTEPAETGGSTSSLGRSEPTPELAGDLDDTRSAAGSQMSHPSGSAPSSSRRLSHRDLERVLIHPVLSLGKRLRAVVPLVPEWSSGGNEQDLQGACIDRYRTILYSASVSPLSSSPSFHHKGVGLSARMRSRPGNGFRWTLGLLQLRVSAYPYAQPGSVKDSAPPWGG